jgi:predicted transcriptional regulator
MQEASTIYIRSDLKEKLTSLKIHPRESYSAVIERLLSCAIDPDPLTPEEIAGIEEALADIKAGRVHSEEEIMKEFGVE